MVHIWGGLYEKFIWEVHMRWSIWEVHITGQRFQLKVKWQGFVDDAGPVGSLHPWWEISVAKSDQGSSDWWFHQKPQLILRKYRLFRARRDTSFYETDPDTIKKDGKVPRPGHHALLLFYCFASFPLLDATVTLTPNLTFNPCPRLGEIHCTWY